MPAYILDSIILKSLKKPSKLQRYNGTRDPDEHVKHVDDQMGYHHVDGVMNYKLFALSLIESTTVWCQSLSDRSIDYWFDLCEAFTVHFTTIKRKLTTMVGLSGITQGKKETLHIYIECFTNLSLKCWIFEKCLRLDCAFWEKIGRKEAHNLKDLLSKVRSCINYEELVIHQLRRIGLWG